MKLDTLGVQAFIAVADQASFQKAADELHISQTAVTRRLQNLEFHLGTKLIERSTRNVALTSTGRDFLPQARRLMDELSNALAEIAESGKSRRGNVSIACVPTAGVHFLPRIVQEYSACFPDNRITILDHSSASVADAVIRREACMDARYRRSASKTVDHLGRGRRRMRRSRRPRSARRPG